MAQAPELNLDFAGLGPDEDSGRREKHPILPSVLDETSGAPTFGGVRAVATTAPSWVRHGRNRTLEPITDLVLHHGGHRDAANRSLTGRDCSVEVRGHFAGQHF